jgi:cation diffusion facilitator CzcD-associated flavoprotein CzcO
MFAVGLEELARRARYELQCLGYPTRPWVEPVTFQGERVHDVVIVGGGQSGVAIAFGLLREQVTDVVILDSSPGGQEGPWSKFARMHTLRTPKAVVGPDLGIPSLSARAWYEAKFGAQAWDELDKIPRDLWQDYLLWLRQTIGVIVRNDTEVFDIEPLTADVFAVHMHDTKSGQTLPRLLARKIVLATGIEGSGRWHIPPIVSAALPRECYAHTADQIDFSGLNGKRVVVLGAGASAFDNAAVALEQGAASVDLLVRRPQIPTVNPNRWIEFAGFLHHFGDLNDEMKWRFMSTLFRMNQPPPQDTFDRCAKFGNFHIHLESSPAEIQHDGGQIVLTTQKGTIGADFLIVGTGLAIDFNARPELRRVFHAIARWKDRYTPPVAERNDALGEYPYLSGSFQFTEREPGSAPHLRHIYCYTFAAMPSLANSAGISQLKFGVSRIVFGITRDLFVAGAQTHLERLRNYNERELVHATLPNEGRSPMESNGEQRQIHFVNRADA